MIKDRRKLLIGQYRWSVIALILFYGVLCVFTVLTFLDKAFVATDQFLAICFAGVYILMHFYIRFFPFIVVEGAAVKVDIGVPPLVAAIVFVFSQNSAVMFFICIAAIAAGLCAGVLNRIKILKNLNEEPISDYNILEMRTYKYAELNIGNYVATLIFTLLLLFAGDNMWVVGLSGFMFAVVIAGTVRKCYGEHMIKRNDWRFCWEIVCLTGVFAMAGLFNNIRKLQFIPFVLALLFAVPPLIFTIQIHKELKDFMYK